MTAESIKFLDENRYHYDLLINAGVIKHLDNATKEGLRDTIRREFDGGYLVNLWCGECIAAMITFAYVQYDKYLEGCKK